VVEFAYQVAAFGTSRRFFCSLDCRRRALGGEAFRPQRRARRIAILNQKGGTGKTTTAVNLAAGVAERGFETLLIDMDAQGNVGASLGVRGERTLYHVLVENADPAEVAIPVRGHLDVICSDATLAAAEVDLARRDDGHRSKVLAERMCSAGRRWQYIIVDCGPSLSLLNQNALTYVDEVVIPVACDYLALVGVKQVLRTLKDLDRHFGHAVRISAVIPTFYDRRVRLAREAVETLKGHFRDRLLEPVRQNSRLAEAPSKRQTIFEYAPESHGAEDYRRVVEWLCTAADGANPTVPPTRPQPTSAGASA
jgi:chromosome partitioning protein